MRIGDRVFCVGCLNESALVRCDKYGRPMLLCDHCGQKTFFRGRPSLVGYEKIYGALSLALRDNNIEAAKEIIATAPREIANAH